MYETAQRSLHVSDHIVAAANKHQNPLTSSSQKHIDSPRQYTVNPFSHPSMAENELKQIISQLDSLKANNVNEAPQLLSRAKLALLHLKALVPSEDTQPQHLALAASVLELGALNSIKLKDTDAFTRYYQQLQPFYSLSDNSQASGRQSNQSKVTGLYLLLLLSVGDYAGVHTVLEGLEQSSGKEHLEKDEFIQYPVRLEQALMEGSYDKVWGETKGERVPSEEYAVFSEVCFSVPIPDTALGLALTRFLGPHQHHPLRNRFLLRTRIPVTSDFERQEPAFPRLRRCGHSIRAITRLGGKGWQDILPAAGRGDARGGKERHEQQWRGD